MKKNTQKNGGLQGGLTVEKAKEYAINDLKVSIGFLEFVLRQPEVIQLLAEKMLILQEQIEQKKQQDQPKETEL